MVTWSKALALAGLNPAKTEQFLPSHVPHSTRDGKTQICTCSCSNNSNIILAILFFKHALFF